MEEEGLSRSRFSITSRALRNGFTTIAFAPLKRRFPEPEDEAGEDEREEEGVVDVEVEAVGREVEEPGAAPGARVDEEEG